MKQYIFCFLLLASLAGCHNKESISRIAFGSCSNQDSNDQMWLDIIAQKPQLCIWLGDNIYADTHDLTILRSKYDKQKKHPDYQKLIHTIPVIGTWDDHDYGENDGGKNFSMKKESKEEFLRYMNIPSNDPIRTHEGVYNAHTYGESPQKIKIILLDTRTFRDTVMWVKDPDSFDHFEPNPIGDILGEKQWQWLEEEMKNSDANIHVIGSSIQFISNKHNFEKWGNFPKARLRLLGLLTKYKLKIPIIISGDRHVTEISKMDIPNLSYALYDFTASGMTHVLPDGTAPESNQYRIVNRVIKRNFGLLRIDWSKEKPKVTMEMRGEKNKQLGTYTIK